MASDPAETPDRVAAELAAIRERAGRYARPGLPDDTGRLLAAVEAVLKRHQPKTVTVRQLCDIHRDARKTPPSELDACPDCKSRQQVTCAACDPICPDDNTWPCADVQAITRELLGEEGSDG